MWSGVVKVALLAPANKSDKISNDNFKNRTGRNQTAAWGFRPDWRGILKAVPNTEVTIDLDSSGEEKIGAFLRGKKLAYVLPPRHIFLYQALSTEIDVFFAKTSAPLENVFLFSQASMGLSHRWLVFWVNSEYDWSSASRTWTINIITDVKYGGKYFSRQKVVNNYLLVPKTKGTALCYNNLFFTMFVIVYIAVTLV